MRRLILMILKALFYKFSSKEVQKWCCKSSARCQVTHTNVVDAELHRSPPLEATSVDGNSLIYKTRPVLRFLLNLLSIIRRVDVLN